MSERKTLSVLDKEPGQGGRAARLPALGTPDSPSFLSRVKEQLEVLTGQRGGSQLDRAVTFRDLGGVLPNLSQANRARFGLDSAHGAPLIDEGTSTGSMTDIDRAIRNSAAFKELARKIGSVEDLETFPDEIRAVLRNELGKIAAERGAAIEESRTIVQEATRSYAAKVTEVTASLGNLSAGVRHMDAAFANQNRAFATSLTQVTARLDNAGGTGVTVEEKFVAQADQISGLLGQWSVKIVAGTDANPVIAGVSLSVESPTADGGTSSFVIRADKFGLYTSGGTKNPFAVSGSTVTMNADVRIQGSQIISSSSGTGQRIAFNEGGNNMIEVYDSIGTKVMEVGGSTGTLRVIQAPASYPGVSSTSAGGPLVPAIYGNNSAGGIGVWGANSSSGRGVYASNSGSGAALRAQASTGNAIEITGGANAIVQTGGGSNYLYNVLPSTDNAYALGASGVLRWTALYAMSATITTSDLRTKNVLGGKLLGLDFINDVQTIRYTMKVAQNLVTENWVVTEPEQSIVDDFGNLVVVKHEVRENRPIITPRAGKRIHYGVPAQQLRETLVKHGEGNAAMWCLSDPLDPDSQQAVRYEELIAPLIRAVQELSGQVDTLKQKVAALEGALP